MSLKLKDLTGKKVRTSIKNGWTMEDFCERYDCSQEELFSRIERIYTVRDSAQMIWNEIQSNRKKPRVKAKPAQKKSIQTEKVAEDAGTKAALETIDELKLKEETLSKELVELEMHHKYLSSERLNLKKAFQQVIDEINGIKSSYASKCHEAETIVQKDTEIVNQMNEIADVYRGKRSALETLRKRIEEESKIAICVYAGGEIAVLDEEIAIQLSDEGHERIFAKLREREEAEDFRPKDLRIVAKVIQTVSNLSVPVEIIFDDDEVKRGYEIFTQ